MPKHDHPRLAQPISRADFEAEFDSWWEASGLVGNYSLIYPMKLTATHCRSSRRYAQVLPAKLQFEFAEQVLWLPEGHRLGLIAHELGHVLAGNDTSEEGADAAANAAFQVRIVYDNRWPGKGLQFIG